MSAKIELRSGNSVAFGRFLGATFLWAYVEVDGVTRTFSRSTGFERGRKDDPENWRLVDLTLPVQAVENTIRQQILLAALDLPEVFSRGDLVVACWEMNPKQFGLAGYEDKYPAAHTVFGKLFGNGGLIEKGHISRKTYDELSLTTKGRSWLLGRR